MANLKKFGLIAALLAIGLFGSSCGDSGDSGGEGGADPLGGDTLAEAKAKVEKAGTNVMDLKAVRDWIQLKAAEKGPSKLDLELLADDVRTKIVVSFRSLVRDLSDSDTATASKLRAWADGIIDAEAGKKPADRDPLAQSLAAQMEFLWEIAMKADPNNAALRTKLGYVEHTKDLGSYLELSFIDEDKDIKHIEDLIEAVADDVRKSPDGKKWLRKDFEQAKIYADIDTFVAKLKEAHNEKLKDPFTKAAYDILTETTAFLKQKKNLAAYEWVGRVHHPYLFIIERDSGWDETYVAEKKAKQLDELISLFYEEYRDTFNLNEITKPMPIIVFKRLSSYRQYAVGKTLSGALGHFEHGSDRIVLSDEAERDTMFHEGTHQLMTYHTKGDSIRNFLSRSYWFQEGVAEYFGGTAVYLDKKTKELRFELGVLQSGRLNFWRGNEEQQYSLWDLIGLTFADRQVNIAEGKQKKNLFVYSQGWLLVYFMYNFNVNDKDIVQLTDKPTGKYKQGFLNYMKEELNGNTGRDLFLQCLGLWDKKAGKVDQDKFDKFNLEYIRYYNWLNRKLAMKYHVDDRKPVPWNKVKNKRDRLIGDEEDDFLPLEVLAEKVEDVKDG